MDVYAPLSGLIQEVSGHQECDTVDDATVEAVDGVESSHCHAFYTILSAAGTRARGVKAYLFRPERKIIPVGTVRGWSGVWGEERWSSPLKHSRGGSSLGVS